jgi:DNA-binding NtrC family response regulator/tetratricopeptide (TPR) repeat protein
MATAAPVWGEVAVASARHLMANREGAGRPGPASDLEAATRALSQRPADPEFRARLRVSRASALWALGRARAATDELRKAAAEAGSELTRAAAEVGLARLARARGDAAAAAHHVAAARALGEEAGAGPVWRLEAALLTDRGAWEDALAALDRAEAAEWPAGRGLADVVLDRAQLLAGVGRWAGARAEVDRAEEMVRSKALAGASWRCRLVRGRLHLAAGDLLGARRSLQDAEAAMGPDRVGIRSRGELHLAWSELHLASCDLARAESAAALALGQYSVAGDRHGECRGRVRRSRALLELGRRGEAIREARRAVAGAPSLLVRVGASLALGWALLGTCASGAREVFEEIARTPSGCDGWRYAARLGWVLATGAHVESDEIRLALRSLEGWGDRSLLAFGLGRLREERRAPEDTGRGGDAVEPAERPGFPGIVGRCPAIGALFEQMARAAGSDIRVHVFGETGTGKERVAQALHQRSPRASRPFVAVNAASLNEELFEAEVFGHTRGAFTGAVAERQGLVARADGGTLFVDELTELTPRAQAKLLRFLAEGEYRRLGESEPRRADVRLLTAANQPLRERVAAGAFREDLMYRLAPLTLTLPPLRERGQDVLLLARHFLTRAASRRGLTAPALSPELAQALLAHAWPGNVRELESEMERLLVLSAGELPRCEHLSPHLAVRHGGPAFGTLRAALAVFEREHIARTLDRHAGHRSRAAAALGLSRQGLVGKLRRLGL